jgi:hypothetical protein
LSAEQRRLLEEFARVSGDAGEPASRRLVRQGEKAFLSEGRGTHVEILC